MLTQLNMSIEQGIQRFCQPNSHLRHLTRVPCLERIKAGKWPSPSLKDTACDPSVSQSFCWRNDITAEHTWMQREEDIQLLRSEEQRNKEKTGRERDERREWGGTPSTTTASVIVSLSGRRGLSQSVCLHSRSLKRRQTQEVRKHVSYDCFLLHSTRPPLWSLETEAQLQPEQDSKDLSYTANTNSFQCQTGEEWCEMLVHSTAIPAARWAQLSMTLVSVIAVLDPLSSTRLS